MSKATKTILIVDDRETNRVILHDIFCDDYKIIMAENGEQAINILKKDNCITAVLLDMMMPIADGIEVLEEMNKQGWIKNCPVVAITAENNNDFILKCFELGVSDFISRPFDAAIIHKRIDNVINLHLYKTDLENQIKEQTKELNQNSYFIISALSSLVEYRNIKAGNHAARVRILTKAILSEYFVNHPDCGLTLQEIDDISLASCMHDIGKLLIPDNILNKTTRMTLEERQTMHTHTMLGGMILDKFGEFKKWKYYSKCMDICLHHHERWDGKGYPEGLKGNEISLAAQAVGIADAFDSLTTMRPYRNAYSYEQAMQMLLGGECGTFNPDMIQALKEIAPKIERFYKIKGN